MTRHDAIYSVALGPDCEKLRRDKCPEEPLYDTAANVVDTAFGGGMDYNDITTRPAEAVQHTREVWREVELALKGIGS
jgi:hypothetical protein